ncbi:hypothetical protein FRC00_004318 [Tulasnella sp. 408]|nr:hypothetical protein FRC00_004318 [Tulasnella sp. 408]
MTSFAAQLVGGLMGERLEPGKDLPTPEEASTTPAPKGLSGVAGWIWEPEMAKFREAIFKMKLVRLHIPPIRDPHTEYICTWPGDSVIEDDWDGDLGDEIRKLLQAQPLLEEFKSSDVASITYKTSASLGDKLKHSDIPSLKSLQANPELALAFLLVADRLESLDLTIADWGDRLFSEIETKSAAIRLSILRFSIRVWYSSDDHPWFWENLAKVLSLFPNMEQLSVTVNSLTSKKEVEPAQYYFDMIAENAYVLPCLRSAEVRFETLYPDTPRIFEVQTQSVLKFRTACPLLDTVIDPMKRLWTFRTDHKNPRGFTSQLFGQLIEERTGPVNDL